jgi:hypothetical protein
LIQATILAAVSNPRPVIEPPDDVIVRRDPGISARATIAVITGQTTKEEIARTKARVAVPSVRGAYDAG